MRVRSTRLWSTSSWVESAASKFCVVRVSVSLASRMFSASGTQARRRLLEIVERRAHVGLDLLARRFELGFRLALLRLHATHPAAGGEAVEDRPRRLEADRG